MTTQARTHLRVIFRNDMAANTCDMIKTFSEKSMLNHFTRQTAVVLEQPHENISSPGFIKDDQDTIRGVLLEVPTTPNFGTSATLPLLHRILQRRFLNAGGLHAFHPNIIAITTEPAAANSCSALAFRNTDPVPRMPPI